MTEAPKKYFSTRFGRIAYCESSGTGEQGTILFVHGNSSSSTSFKQQLTSPVLKNYRLIAVDLPGHGQSVFDGDPTKYSVPFLTEVIGDICREHLTAVKAIVGHSLGGHVVLEAANKLTDIGGIVIFGTPPFGKPPAIGEAFLSGSGLGDVVFREDLHEADVRRWYKVVFNDPKAYLKQFEHDCVGTTKGVRSGLLFTLQALNYDDEILVAQNLRIPIAVLHGANDRVVSLDYLKKINFSTLWRQSIQIVEGGSHNFQIESNDTFDRLLVDFLNDLKTA